MVSETLVTKRTIFCMPVWAKKLGIICSPENCDFDLCQITQNQVYTRITPAGLWSCLTGTCVGRHEFLLKVLSGIHSFIHAQKCYARRPSVTSTCGHTHTNTYSHATENSARQIVPVVSWSGELKTRDWVVSVLSQVLTQSFEWLSFIHCSKNVMQGGPAWHLPICHGHTNTYSRTTENGDILCQLFRDQVSSKRGIACLHGSS